MHFTKTILDDRATWASSYQVDEAIDTVEIEPSGNPILDFASKIEKLSPINRKIEHVEIHYATNRTINLSGHKVIIGD